MLFIDLNGWVRRGIHIVTNEQGVTLWKLLEWARSLDIRQDDDFEGGEE